MRTERKTFKYKLCPTPEQDVLLAAVLQQCRILYNLALEERRTAWKFYRKSVTYYQQKAELPELKAAFPEFTVIPSQTAQDVIQRVDTAFQRFFGGLKQARRVGYPRFKPATRYHSFVYPQVGPERPARLDPDGTLYLSKIGSVAVIWSRPVQGIPKTITLTKEGDGWYACISCEEVPCSDAVKTGKITGIDVGLKTFLVTAQGETVANPRYYRHSQQRLKKRQQEVARRPKQADGSNGKNRQKSIEKLQRAHQDIARQRLDMHHKTARWLVDTYDVICYEILTITNMLRNHRLSKSISDAGWGQFLSILVFKAASAGKQAIGVPAAYTTQACSNILPNGQVCGVRSKKTLSMRTHICPSCGYVADRDHNGAGSVLHAGLRTVGRMGTG